MHVIVAEPGTRLESLQHLLSWACALARPHASCAPGIPRADIWLRCIAATRLSRVCWPSAAFSHWAPLPVAHPTTRCNSAPPSPSPAAISAISLAARPHTSPWGGGGMAGTAAPERRLCGRLACCRRARGFARRHSAIPLRHPGGTGKPRGRPTQASRRFVAAGSRWAVTSLAHFRQNL